MEQFEKLPGFYLMNAQIMTNKKHSTQQELPKNWSEFFFFCLLVLRDVHNFFNASIAS